MGMEIGFSPSVTGPVVASGAPEKIQVQPPAVLPALDPVDISVFNVTNRNTDAGKISEDPKEKMSMKDYIAYMLMLIEKLHKYKEDGPGPVRAKMEYQDELNDVLKKLQSN